MKTTDQSAGREARKKKPPPPPVMFRLHSPVISAPDAKSAEDCGDEKEAGGEAAKPPPPPQPAAASTDDPVVDPATDPAAGEVGEPAADEKPPAKGESAKKDEEEGGDESEEKDSITGEINPKSPPHDDDDDENAPKEEEESPLSDDGKPENDKNDGPAKNNHAGLFSDSDSDSDDDDVELPKFISPEKAARAAAEEGKKLAKAEGEAKKGEEEEEEEEEAEDERKKPAFEEEEAMEVGDGKEGTEGMDGNDDRAKTKKPAAGEAKKPAVNEAEEPAVNKADEPTKAKGKKCGEEEELASASGGGGHVKMKHTPRVPRDLPPRKKGAHARRIMALLDDGDLKSPPEELVAAEAAPLKRSARTRRPTEKAVAAAGPKSPPEKVAVAAGTKSPPESKLEAKDEDAKSSPEGGPENEKKRSARESQPRSSGAGPKPPVVMAAASTRRSKRSKVAVVAQEMVSNLDAAVHHSEEDAVIAETAPEPEGTSTPRRSKRKRGQSEDEGRGSPASEGAASEDEGTVESEERAAKTAEPAASSEPSPRKKGKSAKGAAKTKRAPSKPSPRRGMSAKKIEYLEAKKESTWKERIAMMKAHKEIYNSCELGHAPADTVDPLLRGFVLESRKQYKKFRRGERSTLTSEKITELRSLGFEFAPMESGSSRSNLERRCQARWDENFAELERYKAEHGDCLVSSMSSKHSKLGNWVRNQRKQMNKHGREGFNPRRLARLEEIGFDFDPVSSGTYLVKKRANMMPRINAKWDSYYEKLVRFKEEHGTTVVGPKAEGYPGLYDWLHFQRKEYKKWAEGDERALMFDPWIAKMEELGFDWAPMKSNSFKKSLKGRQTKRFDEMWRARYEELKEFRKENGNCYVPRSGDGEVLAGWIHVQRKNKRRRDRGEETALTDERVALLNEIGLDWNPSLSGGAARAQQAARDDEWEATFRRLAAFKERRGHANPKKAEPRIGPWAARMRILYARRASGRRTTLTDERVAKLESIGFPFKSVVDV